MREVGGGRNKLLKQGATLANQKGGKHQQFIKQVVFTVEYFLLDP